MKVLGEQDTRRRGRLCEKRAAAGLHEHKSASFTKLKLGLTSFYPSPR